MKRTFYETKLSFGLEFETEMVQLTSEYYRRLYKVVSKETFRTSTEEEDLYNGADIFADGVPVDFTLAIDDKDNCTVCPKTISLGGHEVVFGFRIGNSHHGFHEFEEPVLVIGVTNVARSCLENVVDDLRKVWGKVIEKALEFYYAQIDRLEEAEAI